MAPRSICPSSASIQCLPLDQPHVDLCFLGRQLGYRGGLKAIEHQLGIPRCTDVCDMSGADAGQLSNRWRHSRDEEARERLLAYNEADCVNLQPWLTCFIAAWSNSAGVMVPHADFA